MDKITDSVLSLTDFATRSHFSSGVVMESAQSSSDKMQLDDSVQEARWEKQLSELARVESLVQKRKAELQRMDAVLIERRHELEEVVHKVLLPFAVFL